MELNISIDIMCHCEQLVEDNYVKWKTKVNKQRSWIAITVPKTLEKNKKWVVEGVEKGWRSHVTWSRGTELNITMDTWEQSEQLIEDNYVKWKTKVNKQRSWISNTIPKTLEKIKNE